MRIAMAVLADAVNVREGMISLLSAGVTSLNRDSFPAPFGVELALMLELEKSDLERDATADISVTIADEHGTELALIEGEVGWTASETWPAYAPTPVDLTGLSLPAPGRYEVRIRVGDLEEIVLHASAIHMSPPADPA